MKALLATNDEDRETSPLETSIKQNMVMKIQLQQWVSSVKMIKTKSRCQDHLINHFVLMKN